MNTRSLDDYSSGDFDALKLHCRRLGVAMPDLETLDVREAQWRQLHNVRSAAKKAAQKAIKELEATKDDSPDYRMTERNHDLLMCVFDTVQEEIELRDANGQTEPLSPVQRSPKAPHLGDAEAHGVAGEHRGARTSGWVEYRNGEPHELRVYSPQEPIFEGRVNGPGVGDIARAMIFGPKSEPERRALSEGTDSAGGYTVPTVLAREFIDKLRARSVVFQAGARTIPMTSDNLAIARVTGDPTVTWTAENAEITASDPTFDAVTLAPKKLTCLVKVARELMEDSVNIAAILEAAIGGRMAEELDRALLFGSGASNQPTGLFNVSGINSVSMGTNGAIPADFDDLIDLLYEVQADNGADPKVFIMNPRTNRTYAKLKDSNLNPLNEPKMTADVRRLLTTAVPIDQDQGTAVGVSSTVLTGDFSKMLVGVRADMELRLLNERYAEFDQVAFIARLRADVAVENPVHFAKLIGVLA